MSTKTPREAELEQAIRSALQVIKLPVGYLSAKAWANTYDNQIGSIMRILEEVIK